MAMVLLFDWLMVKLLDIQRATVRENITKTSPSRKISESLLWKGPRPCGPFPNEGAPVPHRITKLHRGAHHVAALVSSIGRALFFFISANARSMKWQPRQKDGRSGLVGRLDGS